MAVARHGTPTSGASAATTSLVVTYITGLSIGDVAVVQFNINTGTGVTATATGWTAVPGFTPQTQSNTSLQILMYRIIDGTEGATVTFTISLSRLLTWNMVAYSGADPNNSFAGIAQSVAAASTTVTFPATTPQTESAYAVLFYAGGNAVSSDTMTAASSGYSIASDVANPSGARINHSVVQDTHTVFGLPLAAVTPGSATVGPNTENQCKAVMFLRADISGTTVPTVDYAFASKNAAATTETFVLTTGYTEVILVHIGVNTISGAATVSSITGGGLTWAQAVQSNTSDDSEIWWAYAASPIAAQTITVNMSASAQVNLQVISYKSVAASPIGATAHGTALTQNLTTTANNSAVFWGEVITPTAALTAATSNVLLSGTTFTTGTPGNAAGRATSVVASSGTAFTAGLSAPAGKSYDTVAVEVLALVVAPPSSTNTTLLMMGV